MEKVEFKKYFNNQTILIFEKIEQDKIAIEYKNNIATIKFLNEIVGKIEFKFLTGKHISTGAVTSIFLSANVSGGNIWNEIIENKLLRQKKVTPYENFLFYFYPSSSKNALFKNSKTDIFPNDAESKLKALLDFVSVELLDNIRNVLQEKVEAIDDILNYPNYYGQAELTILLLCKKYFDKTKVGQIELDKRFQNSSSIDKKLWNFNKKVLFDFVPAGSGAADPAH